MQIYVYFQKAKKNTILLEGNYTNETFFCENDRN